MNCILPSSSFFVKVLHIQKLSTIDGGLHKHIVFPASFSSTMTWYNSSILIPIGMVQAQCFPAFITCIDRGAWVAGGVTRWTASMVLSSNMALKSVKRSSEETCRQPHSAVFHSYPLTPKNLRPGVSDRWDINSAPKETPTSATLNLPFFMLYPS